MLHHVKYTDFVQNQAFTVTFSSSRLQKACGLWVVASRRTAKRVVCWYRQAGSRREGRGWWEEEKEEEEEEGEEV